MAIRLHRQVLRTIREHALIDAGDRVAVAVSGGSDSVALLRILRDLEEAGDLPGTLAGVIHVNHRLRGDDSDRDERFCRALADTLALRIETASLDVRTAARASGRSIETTARQLRYAFFLEAAGRLGATRVATGHTMDDQAETVLLRLVRGSGSRGLGAIRMRRGPFIRPLLTTRRAALQAFLQTRGVAFQEDASNRSLDIPRNRVRHRLLPVIAELAPGGVQALARLAALAADDEAWLERQAIKAAGSLVLFSDDGVQLSSEGLRALPLPVARRVIRHVLEGLQPGRSFSSRHLEAVRHLAASAVGPGHLDLPGVVVERRGGALMLARGLAPCGHRTRSAFEVWLPGPGAVVVPGAGIRITAETWGDLPAGGLAATREVAVLQAASVRWPLVVRSRRPGDRLRPLGAPGRRKLQDLLVDRKVPRRERDRVPLVVDAEGRIVWVAGVAIAEECRVTAPGAGVVVLKLERQPT